MRKWGRRLGGLALCALAAFLFLALQMGLVYGVMAWFCVQNGGGLLDFALPGGTGELARGFALQYSSELTLAGQALCLAVGLPWWLALRRRRKQPLPAPARALWPFLPAGLALQLLCDLLIALESVLIPARVEEYRELLETAGMTRPFHWQALLMTVLLAPIVEELFCRGLILHYLSRVTRRFWLVNLGQAALFGAFHMNLVQGIYAFLVGLLLGAVFHRYGRLSYCMLLHAAVNGSGSLALLLQLLFSDSLPSALLLGGASALLLAWSLGRTGWRKHTAPDGPEAGERWVWHG